MLSKLSVAVVQEYTDADQVVMTYDMPIIVDTVNYEAVAELVAYHLNVMALELKGLDSKLHSRH